MLAGVAAACLWLAGAAAAQSARPLAVIVFAGGMNWPLWVAEDQGMFARNDLAVKVTATPNSVFQITGLAQGKFDIAITTFDNVVAYQEGQGEVQLPGIPDFFAFMGGGSGGVRLMASPDIKAVADLRGKTLAVDAAATGYALALRKFLQQAGLAESDYRFERVGGTLSRLQALTQNRFPATIITAPLDLDAEAKGYKRLVNAVDALGPYQQMSGMASRAWARQNDEKLISFIRCYKLATDWLYDPANRDPALAIYAKYQPGSTPEQALAAYGALLGGKEGIQPEAKLNLAGVRTVLKLRAEFGQPKKEIGEPAKYIDERYYNDAIRRMGLFGG
jgi:ABC-type nitrate/sulfonate/bicarbonate transport system substrate-binding protein